MSKSPLKQQPLTSTLEDDNDVYKTTFNPTPNPSFGISKQDPVVLEEDDPNYVIGQNEFGTIFKYGDFEYKDGRWYNATSRQDVELHWDYKYLESLENYSGLANQITIPEKEEGEPEINAVINTSENVIKNDNKLKDPIEVNLENKEKEDGNEEVKDEELISQQEDEDIDYTQKWKSRTFKKNLIFDVDGVQHTVGLENLIEFKKEHPGATSYNKDEYADPFYNYKNKVFIDASGIEHNVSVDKLKDFELVYPGSYSEKEFAGTNDKNIVYTDDLNRTHVVKDDYNTIQAFKSKFENVNPVEKENIIRDQEILDKDIEKIIEEEEKEEIDHVKEAGKKNNAHYLSNIHSYIKLNEGGSIDFDLTKINKDYSTGGGVRMIWYTNKGVYNVNKLNESYGDFLEKFPDGYSIDEFKSNQRTQIYIDVNGLEHNVSKDQIPNFLKKYENAKLLKDTHLSILNPQSEQYDKIRADKIKSGKIVIEDQQEIVPKKDVPFNIESKAIKSKDSNSTNYSIWDIANDKYDLQKIVNKLTFDKLGFKKLYTKQELEFLMSAIVEPNYIVLTDKSIDFSKNLIVTPKLSQDQVNDFLKENPNLAFIPVAKDLSTKRNRNYTKEGQKFMQKEGDELGFYYAGNSDTYNFIWNKLWNQELIIPGATKQNGYHDVVGLGIYENSSYLHADNPYKSTGSDGWQLGSNPIELNPEYPVGPNNFILHPEGGDMVRRKGYNNNTNYTNPLLFEFEYLGDSPSGFGDKWEKGDKVVKYVNFDNANSKREFDKWFKDLMWDSKGPQIKFLGVPNADMFNQDGMEGIVYEGKDGFWYKDISEANKPKEFRLNENRIQSGWLGKEISKRYSDDEPIFYNYSFGTPLSQSFEEKRFQSNMVFHHDKDDALIKNYGYSVEDGAENNLIGDAPSGTSLVTVNTEDKNVIDITKNPTGNFGQNEHVKSLMGFHKYLEDEKDIKVNEDEYMLQWGLETETLWDKYLPDFIESLAYKEYLPKINAEYIESTYTAITPTDYIAGLHHMHDNGEFSRGQASPVEVKYGYWDHSLNQSLMPINIQHMYDFELVNDSKGMNPYYQPIVKEEYKGQVFDLKRGHLRDDGMIGWQRDYDASDLNDLLSNLIAQREEIAPGAEAAEDFLLEGQSVRSFFPDGPQIDLDFEPKDEEKLKEYNTLNELIDAYRQDLVAHELVSSISTVKSEIIFKNGVTTPFEDGVLSRDYIGERSLIKGYSGIGFDLEEFHYVQNLEIQEDIEEEYEKIWSQFDKNFQSEHAEKLNEMRLKWDTKFDEDNALQIEEIQNRLVSELNIRWDNGEFGENSDAADDELNKLLGEAIFEELGYEKYYNENIQPEVEELMEKQAHGYLTHMETMVSDIIKKHRPDTDYISASEYQSMDKALDENGFFLMDGDVQKIFLDRMWESVETSLPPTVNAEERNKRAVEFYYYYYNKLAWNKSGDGELTDMTFFALHDFAEEQWRRYPVWQSDVENYRKRAHAAAAWKRNVDPGSLTGWMGGDGIIRVGDGSDHGKKIEKKYGISPRETYNNYLQTHHTHQFYKDVFDITESGLKTNSGWTNYWKGVSTKTFYEWLPIGASIYKIDKNAELEAVKNQLGTHRETLPSIQKSRETRYTGDDPKYKGHSKVDNSSMDVADEVFLNIMAISQQWQNKASKLSSGYRRGRATVDMVPFIFEFVMTRRVGLSWSNAAKTSLTARLTKGLSIRNNVLIGKGKEGWKMITPKQAASTPGAFQLKKGKWIAPTSSTSDAIEGYSFLVGAAAQANHPVHIPRIVNGTVERMSDEVAFMMSEDGSMLKAQIIDDSGMGFLEAFTKSGLGNFAEVMTEHLGRYFPQLKGKKLTKFMQEKMPKIQAYYENLSIARYLKKKGY